MNYAISIIMCLFLFLASSCTNTSEKKTTKPVETNNETLSIKKEEPPLPSTSKPETILQFSGKQNIKDLFNSILVIDTLIREEIKNDTGSDNNFHEFSFNKIIGEVKNRDSKHLIIFPVKPRYGIETYLEKEKDILIVPFYIDREGDSAILTVWERNNGNIQFKTYYKTIVFCKYGFIKVSDTIKVGNQLFYLVEIFLPDEDGMYRKTIIYEALPNKRLNSIKRFELEKIEIDSTLEALQFSNMIGLFKQKK